MASIHLSSKDLNARQCLFPRGGAGGPIFPIIGCRGAPKGAKCAQETRAQIQVKWRSIAVVAYPTRIKYVQKLVTKVMARLWNAAPGASHAGTVACQRPTLL